MSPDQLSDGVLQGREYALAILLKLTDDATKVRAYRKLADEPLEATVKQAREEQGDPFARGLEMGIEEFRAFLRKHILGHACD